MKNDPGEKEDSAMLGSGISEGRTVGPVAGKRPKVALKPGRSLMDWVRLGVSGKDLQGSDGQIKKITMEELSQHDKEDDCWMLLRGIFYYITISCRKYATCSQSKLNALNTRRVILSI